MRSYEVMREAADRIGVKALAAELRLSPALVYKWCQESSEKDPDSSGARNPLDRVAEIARATGDKRVVAWLCREVDGFLVRNPRPPEGSTDEELLYTTQRMVHEFGELLGTVSESIRDDGYISANEADRIRLAWEQLKSITEGFVVACERGLYYPPAT
ncbi:MAG: hypothetical protein JSU68_02530 [Phycisphaerales bacterium]|nr:MAG: hypothetical protein JSU68_02530 [Phycisphaerales bacterium]